MLAIDFSWISAVTNFLLATLIVASLYWATRSTAVRLPTADVVLAMVLCVLVLGLGFVLQPLVWELLISPPSVASSLYVIEYQPARAASNLFLTWLASGLIPGVALGMLLTRSRLGKTRVGACVCTILILSGYDLFLLASTVRPLVWNPTLVGWSQFYETLAQTGYSLICDMIGGFVGGAICWSSLGWLRENLRADDADKKLRAIWHIMIGTFSVFATCLGGYLIFLHPLPANIVLSVGAYQTRTVTFAMLPATARQLLSPLQGSQLEKAISNVAVPIPLTKLQLLSPGLAPFERKLGGDSASLGLSLSIKGEGHGAPLMAKISGAIGCDTPEAARRAAQDSNLPGKAVDLNEVTAALLGFGQDLYAFSASEPTPNATLYIPRGLRLTQVTAPPGGPAMVPLMGALEVPLQKGSTIVLSAIPDVISGIMSGIDAARDAGKTPPVGLSLTGTNTTQILSLPHGISDDAACRATPFLATGSESGTLPPGASWRKGSVVIVIQEADPNAVLQVPTSLFAALHFDSVQDEPLLSGQSLAFVEVKPLSGELEIGSDRSSLHPGQDVQLAADSMSLQDMPGGSFSLSGASRYVLVDGQLITGSLWASLDPNLRRSLILMFVAALGWIVKRHWDTILEKSKEIL